jgi:hypothetical protein
MRRWFERHLNWTWVFCWLFVNALGYISLSFVVSAIIETSSVAPAISRLVTGGLRLLVAMYSGILMLIISGWVINQKGHSLWWLLLFGWWSPVWLSNNKTIVKEQMASLQT